MSGEKSVKGAFFCFYYYFQRLFCKILRDSKMCDRRATMRLLNCYIGLI